MRGSIPACAGEPIPAYCWDIASGVYPRVCGGTATLDLEYADHHGLSPRVRGNLDQERVIAFVNGSIPACAGEPLSISGSWRIHEVYPRVCGGTRVADRQNRGHEGLSPRVRGNLPADTAVSSHPRSIPACAGEPIGVGAEFRNKGVYPRVCGGTQNREMRNDEHAGLSPRVRGNRPNRRIIGC